MIVWLTQTGEPYPFQNGSTLMRTGLLAKELSDRGHTVVWWGTSFYHQKKQMLFPGFHEVIIQPTYSIKLLPGLSYKRNFSLRRYVHHKKVARSFARLAQECERPDVIVASLPVPELAYEAVHYGQQFDISTVVDVRDLWPHTIVENFPRPIRPFARIGLHSSFKKTRYTLSGANSIVACSRFYLDWALNQANRLQGPKDRIFWLGSTSPKSSVSSEVTNTVLKDIVSSSKNMFIASFLGSFGRSYDLSLIVKAAKKANVMGVDGLLFILAGDGDNYGKIEKLARNLSNVVLTGWLGQKEIDTLLKHSSIGIAPYVDSAGQELPNKPFQYAAAGLPIIASLKGELEEILASNKMGFNYSPGNVDEFLELVIKLKDNLKLRSDMGNNALNCFQNHFESGRIYSKFADFLEQLHEED